MDRAVRPCPGPSQRPWKITERTIVRDEHSTGAEAERGEARTVPDGPVTARSRGLSPLTRKIVVFNLIALNLLVAGVLYLHSGEESPLQQFRQRREVEAELMAGRLAVPPVAPVLTRSVVAARLQGLGLGAGARLLVLAPDGALLGQAEGPTRAAGTAQPTPMLDVLGASWRGFSGLFLPDPPPAELIAPEARARAMLGDLHPEEPLSASAQAESGRYLATLAAIVPQGADAGPGGMLGAVALITPLGQVEAATRAAQERALRIFAIATLVSSVMSLLLASTIARPLSDLTVAAEAGGAGDLQRRAPARVSIPDMTARSDEIGRLSGALRGMVAALYDRIDSNEQFAADVAHEIKNPLASLRAAVGTLRMARREDHRATLLDVIEHDVRRLDRLVSDISDASRLDSELVREEEQAFDLLALLRSLTAYLGGQAGQRGIDFITDLPDGEIVLRGLEPRLAQVFVNLISNAVSFCKEGDAIRVWVRRRANRVLVVVEDTGPGIPDEALQKIFARFYSHRPEAEFGNHSGLGLAISKQIVEAHGGVIWAENIRTTGTAPAATPLGARFVVGLPV
ncbi:HAMP domain-containing protein [Pseudooceanicola sediminis]|uniref:histidine kinase n=1 Tax=Pseudooceanicola sediminis TaxID=2211117 RepID=A0A399J3M7_9RHOB|nr:ATP-binding protein [Pseudooceanicola sediminis]KAA2313615.1 HAMP domain-containing protein [Puniceibacterium sp. HSS470]RII38542.1 HAMP domain-containing protein [Pseudooceanicola sediminis]|tara:strand:+ start:9356 stop:11068 length:1713 start_codon:yes stop_codon:yes gene_type:complete